MDKRLVMLASPFVLRLWELLYFICYEVCASGDCFPFEEVETEENVLIGVFEEEGVHSGGGLVIHHV